MDIADFNRRLESLIRLGTIADVDHDAARVRVHTGSLTTTWLPWLTDRAGQTTTWNPPTVGEQVIVLSPSGDPATGVVLLALFAANHPAPSSSPDTHVTDYPDGARIEYNHATGALSATGIQTALVHASTHVTVDCPDSTFTGNVVINGKLTVLGDAVFKAKATVMKLFSYLSGMAGAGGSGGGSTQITGNITHSDGSMSSNGVVLHTHSHGGVASGPASTGGPQ